MKHLMRLHPKERILTLSVNIYTIVEVTDGNKHFHLLQFKIDYSCKKFYSTGPMLGGYAFKMA
jgi:hypothetical protein